MAARPSGRASRGGAPRGAASRGGAPRTREPATPRPPASLELATVDEHDLEDEACFDRLGFFDLDLAGRAAGAASFEQCRFQGADLSGTTLERVRLTDCLVERSSLANVRADGGSMTRVRLSTLRMTGLHWTDGLWRDVAVEGCRLDLSSLRFTDFQGVVFADCNLSRADFTGADLSGVRFVRCDLSAAQFAEATTEGTRLVDCVLTGIAGVTSLAGAVIADGDLVGLAHALAAALNITIEGAD